MLIQINQNIIIPAGSVANTSIVGLEGRTYIDQFQGTGGVGQSFQLSYFPVIFDSVLCLSFDGYAIS